MASQKFGFVTVDPVSGSGVQAVTLTGDVHTGRLQRTKAFNVQATGVEAPKVLTVNQSAAEENVKAASPTASIEKTGGSVTITGTSNSTKLTFAVNPGEENQLNLTLPENYLAGGVSTANGVEIADDPGAAAEYTWSITFENVPANTSVSDLTATLTITAAGAQSATVAITQSAGDPYINLDKETVTMNAAGDAVTVNVDSNTTWTWSEVVAEMILRAMRAKK